MTTPTPDHRRLFGGDPAGYDRARPDYPSRVYEILTARCGLRPGAATLEIGPGSGLATRRLLALGADPLVAVEPDERLAGYLSEQLRSEGRSIVLHVAAFEEAALDESSFDLIVSATAFHWLNQPVALAKAGRLLRSGGWLANWWNVFGDSFGVDAFHEATKHVMEPLGRPAANADGRLPFPLDAEARLADLRAAGLFDEIDHEIMPWPARFTPSQIRALYSTFPNVSGLPEPRRSEVLAALGAIAEREFGGLVERTFYTSIYTARRV
ncbi:MAG: class I SAM-dependent methyltransferase [Chloroflexi bacterium]|nr:class I SAM-dependent methyltransferase [Chloroflexota bacterium]